MDTQATLEQATDHMNTVVFQRIVLLEKRIDNARYQASLVDDIYVHLNKLTQSFCQWQSGSSKRECFGWINVFEEDDYENDLRRKSDQPRPRPFYRNTHRHDHVQFMLCVYALWMSKAL